MAFHLTFVSGADKALTALADQDFPSYTCCHSCIRVFVLIIQRVRIRSCQSMISRAGFFFLSPLQYCKSSLTFGPSFVIKTIFFY